MSLLFHLIMHTYIHIANSQTIYSFNSLENWYTSHIPCIPLTKWFENFDCITWSQNIFEHFEAYCMYLNIRIWVCMFSWISNFIQLIALNGKDSPFKMLFVVAGGVFCSITALNILSYKRRVSSFKSNVIFCMNQMNLMHLVSVCFYPKGQ